MLPGLGPLAIGGSGLYTTGIPTRSICCMRCTRVYRAGAVLSHCPALVEKGRCYIPTPRSAMPRRRAISATQSAMARSAPRRHQPSTGGSAGNTARRRLCFTPRPTRKCCARDAAPLAGETVRNRRADEASTDHDRLVQSHRLRRVSRSAAEVKALPLYVGLWTAVNSGAGALSCRERSGRSTKRARPTTRKFMTAVTTNTMCQLPVDTLIRFASGTRKAEAPFAV